MVKIYHLIIYLGYLDMKKYIISLILLLLINGQILSQSYEAELEINMNPSDEEISPYFHGAFIEVVDGFVNGTFGFAAQELENRGFDMSHYEQGLSSRWFMYFLEEVPVCYLNPNDMINQNGVYSQTVQNKTEGYTVGIMQETYIDDVGCEFYVYMKSYDNLNVLLRILDRNDKHTILFETKLGNPDTVWRKLQ